MNTPIKTAREFAIAAHAAQRYGPHPYSFHLDAIVEILQPFGETAQIIGYLHDVVEDTAIPLADIQQQFGDHIASCVALLTDSPGENRAARKALTHAKLAKVTGDLQLALIVKAADRLANLRMCIQTAAADKLQMYQAEHSAFRAAAFRPGLCDSLWLEIDQIIAST